MQFSTIYRRNTYSDELSILVAGASFEPSAGVRRRDEILRADGSFGYQFNAALRASLGVTADYRNSNMEQIVAGRIIDPFKYHVTRIYIRLDAGWL